MHNNAAVIACDIECVVPLECSTFVWKKLISLLATCLPWAQSLRLMDNHMRYFIYPSVPYSFFRPAGPLFNFSLAFYPCLSSYFCLSFLSDFLSILSILSLFPRLAFCCISPSPSLSALVHSCSFLISGFG